MLKNDHIFEIQVTINKKTNQIIFADNGIGMDKKDLITNLGTIANSGTQKFLENISGDTKKDMQLIGQFGVGFYSAFMVAKSIEVLSTKAGQEKTYIWKSEGKGEYSVEEYKEKLSIGTTIKLDIKESESKYLDKHHIKHVISTYSDHIAFPIKLIDEEGKEEVINKASALWMRNPSEITEQEYNEFFHHVSHFPGEPLMTFHNKVEGNIQYTSLLYIPKHKPYDLFHPDRQPRVKLYINRVFIAEEGIDLIPSYMRFLRGVVDSDDLPLNISRETLQHNLIIEKIRKSIVKKVLTNLKKKSENEPKEFDEFWNNFGEVMKEGLCEGALEEKEQLLEVCRFNTTNSADSYSSSLDQYIERMQKGQDFIFYVSGDNLESLRNNPQLEGFKKRNIEVILLTDHVDDFWVNVVHQYKDKELKSVNTEGIDLNKIKEIKEETQQKDQNKTNNDKEHKGLINYIKNVLKDKIKDVKISSKLITSPACLSIPEGSMSSRMEKFLMDQKQLKKRSAKILEINPKHSIFKRVLSNLSNPDCKMENEDLIYVIYNQACLIDGENLENPCDFATRLNTLLDKK